MSREEPWTTSALPALSAEFQARYKVSRLLGEGGMGTVHLAWDEELSRQVAIKFLRRFGEGKDSHAGQRFAEEARVCAQLKHPSIVRLYTLGWEGDVPYLVFEFVMGSSLADEIEARKRLSIERAMSVGLNLLHALAAAHEQGVIHRDVKPANVLLRSEDGRAMLADFGLARSTERTSFKTEKNLVLGTPAFMAPEVLRGEPADAPADLYGVGCTLYACLTGAPPLVGKTDAQTLEMQLKVRPTRPAELIAELPAALDDLIMGALAKAPGLRPGSAAKMAEALSEIARRTGLSLSADSGTRLPALLIPAGDLTRPASRAAEAHTQPVRLPSHHLRARTRAREAPSAAVRAPSRSRRKLAGVAVAGVLLGLVAGGWWWVSRGRVVGARVVLQGGSATITWETQRATVGRVIVKEGTARQEDVWEPSPARMHTVTVRELAEGRPHEMSIIVSGDEPAWSARFVPPAPLAARLSSVPGAKASRVSVRGTPVPGLVLRLSGTQDGETIADSGSATPTFEVPHPAAAVSAGARLEQQLGPGVYASHPVDTVVEQATRLADALENFRAGPIVSRLVSQRTFDTWKDFAQSLGAYSMLAHGEVPEKPSTPKPGNYFRHVRAEAEKLPFYADLEAFRPEAAGYFSHAAVPDAAKLRLYRGLLKLRPLDLLSAAQHDPENLRSHELYATFVRPEHTLDAPARDPAASSVLPDLISWQTKDFFDWPGFMWWAKRNQTFARLHPAGDWSSEPAVRSFFLPHRTARIGPLAGAGGSGTAELTAVVLALGPSYFFEVSLAPADGGDALPLVLSQSGTAEWFEGMDRVPQSWDNNTPPAPSDRPPDTRGFAWGQIRLSFPARLLPAGPISVRVTYDHLPGVAVDKLSNIQRLCHTREITLRVHPDRVF